MPKDELIIGGNTPRESIIYTAEKIVKKNQKII